jgi:WD40 repeat protein
MFLQGAAAPLPLIAELVHSELELRLKAGEAARVEDYWQRYPGLAEDAAIGWSLIEAEFRLRQRREPALSLNEYRRRFSRWSAELDRLEAEVQRPTLHRNTGEIDNNQAATPCTTQPFAEITNSTTDWPRVPGLEVIGLLGRGGMGVVYRAWQERPRREVALKLLHQGLGPEEAARFRTEAEAAARMRHPNLLQLYQVGEHDGRPYLILEYAEGGTLAARQNGRPWPVHEAAELMALLAEAVDHAHVQGVLHRDLSPANVLFDAEGRPKVADFGLAKLFLEAGPELTGSGVTLGTPSYMSPEQAAGRARGAGLATDIYALGAILYELITGRPPFRGESAMETIHQVLHEDPVPPSRLRRSLPRDLETVCLKCLRKDPADRYARAGDLAVDLRRFLRGERVLARPPSAVRAVVHWVRRHPAATAALLGTVALAVVVTVGSLWHSIQVADLLQEAQGERAEARRNEQWARAVEYARDVRLGYAAYQRGDPFVLAGFLDSHRPEAAGTDRRGFEWWYLSPRHLPPIEDSWLAHERSVRWLTYSPNGRWLATLGDQASGRWSIKVWNARTRRLQLSVPTGGIPFFVNPERFFTTPPLAFAPGDSDWVAVPGSAAGGSAIVRLDLRTGRQLGKPLRVDGELRGVAVTPGGRSLFVVEAHAVTAWDLATESSRRLLTEPKSNIVQFALSPDGKTLALIINPGTGFWKTEVLNLATGARKLLYSERGILLHPLFSPRQSLVAAWWLQKGPILADTTSGLYGVWDAHEMGANGVPALAPDGQTLAVGCPDGDVQLWSIRTQTLRARLHWQGVEITGLSYRPDGRKLAVAARDGMVFQVDVPTWQIRDRLRPALAPVPCLACTPDGKTLAVADRDLTIKLLDLPSGQLKASLRGAMSPARALAFSPDGRHLAAVTRDDGHVVLWDAQAGKLVRVLPVPRASSIAFSHSAPGSLLAVGTESHAIILLDAATGDNLTRLMSANRVTLRVAFSPAGDRLAATGDGSELEIWDVAGGHLTTAQGPLAHLHLSGSGAALAFHPDGQTFVTGGSDGQIRFWALGKKQLTEARPSLTTNHSIQSLEVSRDGRSLLVNQQGRFFELWDWQTLQHRLAAPGVEQRRCSAVFLGPATKLAAVNPEGSLEFWDTTSLEVRTCPAQPLWSVRSLAFTPDGKTLITGSDVFARVFRAPLTALSNQPVADYQALQHTEVGVRTWNVADGAELGGPTGAASMSPPCLVSLAPDGRFLAAGSLDGRISVWDRKTNTRRKTLFVSPMAGRYVLAMEFARRLGPAHEENTETVLGQAFSSDGKLFAAAGSSGIVTVWATNGWQPVQTLPCTADGLTVSFAPGGYLLISQGGQVQFHDPYSGAERRHLGSKAAAVVTCMACSADGKLLAVGRRDRRIQLWDLSSGRLLGEMNGHEDRINALAFTPDGKTLASASSDRTVKLWNVATVREVGSLEAHRGEVYCLAFSADGSVLASGGRDDGWPSMGEVYLWRAPRP